MPERFKKYLTISLCAHLAIALFILFSPQFNFSFKKPSKVTWLQLSKGDGGTNLRSNQKNLKNLPASTIREQKEVLKELAKSKKGQDRITKESTTKKTNPADK